MPPHRLLDAGDLATPPDDYQAFYFVMGALKRRDLSALRRLRDATGELESVVAAWAKAQHLLSPVVNLYLQGVLHWWRHQPIHASRLTFDDAVHGGMFVVPSPRDEAWEQQQTHHRNLPNPQHESLAEWLARARDLYQSRAAVQKHRRKRRLRRTEFERQCDWFIQVHVQGVRPSVVAKATGINRAAIERGTDRIAALLGLQRRRWRPGRPLKKL
jgi:hypothetical protein